MDRILNNIYLYVLNGIVACLLFLFGMNFYTYWIDFDKPQDYLSVNHISFILDSDEGTEKFVNYITDSLGDESFYLHQKTNYGYSWIVSYNKEFPAKILSGRKFNNSDYDEKRNVAMVSDTIFDSVYKQENKMYIDINGNQFEVIGIFENEVNKVHPQSEIYLNMTSYAYDNNYKSNRFDIDCREKTSSFFYDIQKVYNLNKINNDLNLFQKVNIVLDSQKFSIKIYIEVFLICLIVEVLSSIIYVKDRKQEIYVRIICGATQKDIFIKYITEYQKILSKEYCLLLIICLIFRIDLFIPCIILLGIILCSCFLNTMFIYMKIKKNIIELR